jgi:hypothetical protein
MRTQLLRLAFVLALLLPSACWACGSHPLPRTDLVEPSALSAKEVTVKGELRFYRHIDLVTGHGAVYIYTGEKEIPLDLRQFKPDIFLQSGHYVVKGRWSKERRLVVTAAHPAGGQKAVLPESKRVS